MKKLFSCLLAVLMIASLAACGGTPAPVETPPSGTSDPAKTPDAPAAPAGGYGGDTTQAYAATEEEMQKVYAAVKDQGLRVACSNSYIGNTWRAQMINTFSAYCRYLVDEGIIAEFYSSSCGADSDAQINEISNMVSAGYDIIVVDAASPTALNTVCEEAMERGVIIVGFDSVLDDENLYNVAISDYDFGAAQAQFMVDQLGGQGNIINIRGVEGSTNDNARQAGIDDVFAQNPGINVVATLWGGWDDATTSSVLMDALSSLKGTTIDGIIQAGGENGVFEALEKNNIALTDILIAGDCMNGFFKLMAEEGLKGISVACPPCLVCAAVQMGLQVAAGQEVEMMRYVELPVKTYEQAAEVYLPDLPDNFLTAYTDANNTYHLDPAAIVANK